MVLTQVIVSDFGKPSPQKRLGIPHKIRLFNEGVIVPIDHCKYVRAAWGQFRQYSNARTTNFGSREPSPIPKNLFNRKTLTRIVPFNGILLDGGGVVHNADVT